MVLSARQALLRVLRFFDRL